MPDSRTLIFESYQLDLRREQLRRGEDAIPLTNKAFAVLCYLVEHAEQLITRDALLEAVWPDTFVSDAALTVCIHELRQALREKAQTPRLIETVRGRGYRFLAPVTVSVPAPTRHEALPPSSLQLAFSHPQSVGLVGREAELLQLHQGLVTALQGERQVIFITGEAGIGKTTLVEAFLAQIARDQTVWIGYGQCIDQYGAGEAYLPLLEALGRLCRGPDGQALMELLRQEAPSWLLQMAALLSFDEFDALQRRGGGATRERMLRELAEALERLTVDRPFVLVLEDLHWSDSATLEWLAYVARRRDPARLLVLCTYRPVEAIVQAHPLRTVTQELRRLGQCAELMLDYLPESGVAAYIVQRCGDTCLPTSLIQRLHHRTNGNPLFMVTVVDGVARHLDPSDPAWQEDIEAALVKIPETLRQLIEHQLSQIDPDDQVLLETASVVGITFTAAAIAAALGTDEIDVENRCEALSRRELFMQSQGIMEWPDGTVTTRYGFSHALHQEVLYDRVAAGRRVRLHRHIGTRQETGYGTQ
ncbi:MAG: AAA family ATPase, partial [Candidatus Tectomicrobia bacterium]|nr:AAA family ATPase [Candidatus Tectomicrobia bacterium]